MESYFSTLPTMMNSMNVWEKWYNYLHTQPHAELTALPTPPPVSTHLLPKKNVADQNVDMIASVQFILNRTKKRSKVQFRVGIVKVFPLKRYFITIKPSNKPFFNEFFDFVSSFELMMAVAAIFMAITSTTTKIVYLQLVYFIRIDATVVASVDECDTLTSLQRQFKIENIFYSFYIFLLFRSYVIH